MDGVNKQSEESCIVSCHNIINNDVEDCEYSNCSSSKRLAFERIPSFSSSSNTDEEEEVEKLSNVSNEESEKSTGEYLYEEEVEETEEEEIEEIKDLSEYEFNKDEHQCNIFNDNNIDLRTEHVNTNNNGNETTNKDTEYAFYETKYDDDDNDDEGVEEEYPNAIITNTQKSISSSQQGQGLETIIIMDYDDTILASSWLVQNRMDLYTPDDIVTEFAEELRLIEAAASKLLTKAIELGEVHLITNAEEGWIELTVEKFIPGIRPLLQHVSIVSARTSFERYHPTCPRSWKVLAFRQQISNYVSELTESSSLLSQSSKQQLCLKEEGDSVTSTVAELTVIGNSDDAAVNADGSINTNNGGKTSEKPSESLLKQKKINLISLGDSQHEREALQIVATEFPNSYAKTIKFVERPDIAKLQKQMELMHICMDYICEYEGNLDLMLSQIIDKDINHIDNENNAMGAF